MCGSATAAIAPICELRLDLVEEHRLGTRVVVGVWLSFIGLRQLAFGGLVAGQGIRVRAKPVSKPDGVPRPRRISASHVKYDRLLRENVETLLPHLVSKLVAPSSVAIDSRRVGAGSKLSVITKRLKTPRQFSVRRERQDTNLQVEKGLGREAGHRRRTYVIERRACRSSRRAPTAHASSDTPSSRRCWRRPA